MQYVVREYGFELLNRRFGLEVYDGATQRWRKLEYTST